MPEYSYRAVDKNGIMIKNRVQEKSKHNLVKKLKANNLTPIEVTQTSFGKYKARSARINKDELMKLAGDATAGRQTREGRQLSRKEKLALKISKGQKIETRDIIVFTQNFYLLKKAGFNNIHALSTLVESTENTSLKGILEDVLAGVEGGDYMYTTLEYYSDIFPYIYINLIKVGELSGSLDESLKQAAEYMETSSNLTKKLRSILIPNILEFVVLFAILIFGSLYVIPIIQNVFIQVGSTATLPWYTMLFSKIINWIVKVWYIPFLILAGIAAYVYISIQNPKGRYNWDYFKYRMPIFGKLIYTVDLSRVLNAMLLNLRNGMRIQEALENGKNVVKNYVMLSILEASINNIIVGENWVTPFEESGLTNPMVTEMLKIGMQTDLPTMMESIVKFMNMDIDNIVSKIIKILPQILYTVVGVLIILITVVVLVPCIQVYMGTFLFEAAGV